jgi:hypothetical protein
MEALTVREYEQKALKCHRLARYCANDRAAWEALTELAREYELMVATHRAAEDRRAA